ncbi:hypothetical protein [Morganella morganii]|uniref:hypothetical protein n=1 Tax=Morganella morganii TaxID=582 RepID=UPI0009073A3E|nr:hypothetical protein [Morganella morganii]
MSCRGYHCARARRAARRQNLQAKYRLNTELKTALNGECDEKRPLLSLNRQPMDRVTKALSVSHRITRPNAV